MRRFGMGRVLIKSGLVAIALAIAPVVSLAQDSSTSAPAIVVTPATAPALPPQLAAIREARDPSAAINAYANAITQANGRAEDIVAAEDALVRQMVSFGLPEMADTQAQDLVARDPKNGVAWAVAAHLAAKRGDPSAALSQVEVAAERSPDDPFVQRTAGQVLAWFDARADQSKVSQ